jgi:hypothetical protein
MPGAYAHITAVNEARGRIGQQAGFPPAAEAIVFDWLKFCELGAVSPDLPYLDVADGSRAGEWADAMHWRHAWDRIKTGIEVVGRMQEGDDREKSLAWLLGFTSHVIMDVTVHPVVGIKAGQPYEQHKKEHRTCEMHQDTYIFQTRMNLGIHYADYLKAGVSKCTDPAKAHKLDPIIPYVWNEMFKGADMTLYAGNGPQIEAWYDFFKEIVDHIAESRLVALARHVCPKLLDGAVYPLFADVDQQFLVDLEVPVGQPMSYDDIFDLAVGNVVQAWAAVSSDVLTGRREADRFLKNWNLDTGEESPNILTFWSVS